MGMDLFQLKVDNVGCCATLPGYKRAAYGVTSLFGVGNCNICSLRHFALGAHLNQSNGDMLVEIISQMDGDWGTETEYAPIDGGLFCKLILDVPDFNKKVVYMNGRLFFRGYDAKDTPEGISHSYSRCMKTNAFAFLRGYGNDLATALTFPDKVRSIASGTHFNALVSRVAQFKDENAGEGTISYEISRLKKSIERTQADIADIDKELRHCNEIYARSNEVLAKYGITYKVQ